MRGLNLIFLTAAWRAVHRNRTCVKANHVQPSRLIGDGGSSLSEGILSFVEYAPRLLIVLPSRQFWTCTTWVILFRHRRTKGGSKSRPQLYVIGQAFEGDGVTKRDAIKRNTYSQAAFPNWEHRSSLQSLVLRHRRSKGGDKTSTPSNQRPESGRWYLLLLTLPCNTGWSN